ncbi:MAG: ATP-binding cassette domain-containing protein, partial [Gammaproteobacteria bacterium]|nr:ATP-binding cassette domain-containing protein [Gammaproteobacteria bacterium]
LGPNGAGKSTTMKMIAGFLAPTAGSVSVCGHDVEAEPIAAKKSIGYLPEGAPSYPEMTPASFLRFIADLRGLAGDARRRRIGEVVEQLHLEGVLDQPIETLSKGFKRRVGLAQAILHDPKVLILDEPTDGLDPNQKHEVRRLIGGMASDKIIVISTHILEEVNAVCNRAIIIAAGRILADDTPAALESRSRYHNAVTLRLGDTESLDRIKGAVGALPAVASVDFDAQTGRLTAFPRDDEPLLGRINDLVTANDWSIGELQLESGRLDEVFRTITSATDVTERSDSGVSA